MDHYSSDSRKKLSPNQCSSLMMLGVALIIFGLLTLTVPFYTSIALTTIIGVLLLASGIAYSIHAFFDKKWSGFFLSIAIGIVSGIAGLLLIFRPIAGVLTLTLLLGVLLVIQGIVKIIMSFKINHMQGWFWVLLNGIISLLLGIFIWKGWPGTASWVPGLFVSIDLMLAGWSMIFISVSEKK